MFVGLKIRLLWTVVDKRNIIDMKQQRQKAHTI